MGQHVEVPDRSAASGITVKSFGGEYFSGVFIDYECAVVSELSQETVSDMRVAVNVWVRRSHLRDHPSFSDVTNTQTMNETIHTLKSYG